MTTVLILAAAWMAIMTMVVIACRMAAKGDRALGASKSNATRWEDELLGPDNGHAAAEQFRAYRAQSVGSTTLQTATSEHVGNRAQEDLDVGPQ